MRFDALPTKLIFFRMLLGMGIIVFLETVAFSALRFFSETDNADLLIASSSYAQFNNITRCSVVADSTKTFAHSISCFLLIFISLISVSVQVKVTDMLGGCHIQASTAPKRHGPSDRPSS